MEFSWNFPVSFCNTHFDHKRQNCTNNHVTCFLLFSTHEKKEKQNLEKRAVNTRVSKYKSSSVMLVCTLYQRSSSQCASIALAFMTSAGTNSSVVPLNTSNKHTFTLESDTFLASGGNTEELHHMSCTYAEYFQNKT